MKQEELKTLYTTYYTSLCGFASSMLPKHEAHDVVVDIILNAYKSKYFSNDHSYAKAFLFNSVKYKCIDILRRVKNYRSIIKRLAIEDDYFYEIPIDSSKSGFTVRLVMKVINTLPKMQKQVLTLSYVYDLSNKEISNMLGIAERTVINHKQAAFKNLKSILCLQ